LEQWGGEVADLTRAIELKPDEVSLLWKRASAYRNLGNLRRALDDYDQLNARKKDGEGDGWQLADIASEAGLWNRATEAYDRAARRDRAVPQTGAVPRFLDVTAYRRRALAHLAARDEAGFRSGCSELLDECEKVGLDAVYGLHGAVWTASLTKEMPSNPAKLVEYGERAIRKSPDDPDAGLALAAALYRAGRFEEAISQVRKAAEPGRNKMERYLLLALAHHGAGREEEAARWFNKGAVETDRSDSRGLCLDGWAGRVERVALRRQAEAVLRPNQLIRPH
jgi:tetratricopeptide (TPR) repeat protein